MKSEKIVSTPKLEKIDGALRPGVVTRLQREYKEILENPANILIKEKLNVAATVHDDATAHAAFDAARNGLMQRGVLTWPKLHELVIRSKRALRGSVK